MIMLNDTTAVAYNHADLSTAISSDNGIDYVYLGNNITMTSGILVHTAKTALIIDGLYTPESPEMRVLTDSGTNGGQINISGSPSLNITFLNLSIYGRSFYGMPYVHNYTNAERVVVTYRNVTYTGPQMVYHTRGLTRFIDCDIRLEYHGGSAMEEIGEVNRVEIGGSTTMVKTNPNDSVFWFRGSAKAGLKILANANVNISTSFYFMYEDNPPDFIIEQNASLTLNTSSGFSFSDSHTLTSFVMGENASFHYTQERNRAAYAAINLEGPLRAGAGANVYMQADFANGGRLIRFAGSSCGLYLNNPLSFALYNGVASSAPVFTFPAAMPFELIGNQVNYWETPTAFPQAGTFDDTPTHKWNRPELGTFTLRGTSGPSQTNVTYNDFTEEELEDLPPLSNLKLYQAKVFSAGNLPLTVDPVMIGVRPISGTTAKKAKVRAIYLIGADAPEGEADDAGHFSLTPSAPIPLSDRVFVFTNTPFLLSSLITISRDDEFLFIKEAPLTVIFEIKPIATSPYILLPRRNYADPVVVTDTRSDKTEWQIWAKIDGPLRTEDGNVLEDSMVFAVQGGGLLTLGTSFASVHTDGPFPDEEDTNVTWDIDKGLLARITEPLLYGRMYTATLHWSVYPTGVEPED